MRPTGERADVRFAVTSTSEPRLPACPRRVAATVKRSKQEAEEGGGERPPAESRRIPRGRPPLAGSRWRTSRTTRGVLAIGNWNPSTLRNAWRPPAAGPAAVAGAESTYKSGSGCCRENRGAPDAAALGFASTSSASAWSRSRPFAARAPARWRMSTRDGSIVVPCPVPGRLRHASRVEVRSTEGKIGRPLSARRTTRSSSTMASSRSRRSEREREQDRAWAKIRPAATLARKLDRALG